MRLKTNGVTFHGGIQTAARGNPKAAPFPNTLHSDASVPTGNKVQIRHQVSFSHETVRGASSNKKDSKLWQLVSKLHYVFNKLNIYSKTQISWGKLRHIKCFREFYASRFPFKIRTRRSEIFCQVIFRNFIYLKILLNNKRQFLRFDTNNRVLQARRSSISLNFTHRIFPFTHGSSNKPVKSQH